MQGLKDLLDSMSSEDPKTRPTMSSALQSLQEYRQSLSRDELSKRVKAYERNFPFEGHDGLLEPGTLAFEPCIP